MLNAILRSHGDGTIAGKGRENFGLSLAFIAFDQRGNFIVPHLLRHRASVYAVSSKGPSHLVSLYDKQAVSKISLDVITS